MTLNRKLSLWVSLCSLWSLAAMSENEGFKILLLPLPTKSHLFSFTTIGQELAKRGHEVHMLVDTDFPLSTDLTSPSSPITLHRYGRNTGEEKLDYEEIMANLTYTLMKSKSATQGMLNTKPQMLEYGRSQSIRLLSNNDDLFGTLSQVGFHMAVVDTLFFMNFFTLVPHRLGIPWVSYTDMVEPWMIRVPWLPSFVPLKFTKFTDRMSFTERITNTFITMMLYMFPIVPDPKEDIIGPYRRFGSFSSMDDLTSRSLLFISTDNVVLDYPHPQMPNLIHAGGLTVKLKDSKKLEKSFSEFIDGAEKGFIVVSFGSMASTFPDDIANKFLSAFSKFPEYRFIWRFNNRNQLPIPKNTMIVKWLPQNELLAHPKVKLFITHSGNNGQFESVANGVPMIGFPLLGDQSFNARRIEYKGYGIAMNIYDFTIEQLTTNIRKILDDVTYKERVTLASNIFRSAVQTPGERVAYWIEHVTKFGGGHLRSAGNDLYMFQYMMFDVWVVFTIAFLLIISGLFVATRFIVKFLRKFLRSKSKRKES